MLLLALVMTAAGAVLALEGLEPAGWIVEVLPGLVSIAVVQGALVASMLGLIAVMAVRWTVGVMAASAVIAVVGGWLVLAPVFTLFDGPRVVALGAVLVMAAATVAVSGSEDPLPRLLTRLLAVVATAASFCVALFPAVWIGMPMGIMAQSLAGGELGADGLPVIFCGALAGLAGLGGYAAVLMRPNQPVADQPPTSSTGHLLTHRQ